MESDTTSGGTNCAETDSNCNDGNASRCCRTGPNIHETLARTRECYPGLADPSRSRCQSWLWQDASHKFRGRQKAGSAPKAARQCATLDRWSPQTHAQCK